MECPKCGAEINKNALVCPNCKKVLKIVCPKCRTVNSKNVCKNCGEVLVTKCAKCGKINLLKNKKCVKCGFNNEISAVMGESNTDNFALVRIDFPNSDVLKAKLGSNKLFQKFRKNFDALITSYVQSLNVRRQIINNDIYIIRFNKDYTFNASANSAIQATIELLNIITKLNIKLINKKGVGLRCNFTIMQRSTEDNPYNIDSGFHASLVYQNSSKGMKALDFFQVITDESFYDIYKENYKMESLNSTLIDGVMKRFYEMDLKEFVNIGEILRNVAQKENLDDEIEIPNFVQSALIDQEKITKDVLEEENGLSDDQIYDIDMIKFDEINCEFIKTESINILDCVVKTLQQVPKGIFAIKASDIYQPYTLKLLSSVDELGIYDNIIPITCHNDMKYSPYSFFRELISSVFEYSVSQKLFETNDFSMFANVDGSDLVKDLITLTQRPMNDIEQTSEQYCQVFVSLLQAIPNTLIYIENFEKIDASSLFVMEQLFDYIDEVNISWLISYDKNFSLHKKMHYLLSRPYYTEVTLTPTPFETIVGLDIGFYRHILTDFYFQRIAKYTCGSTLFLDFAIQYLIESDIYEYTEDAIMMVNPKTIIIPSTLDKLIKRRLNLLKDDVITIKFLTTLVLLGTRIDERTINSLEFKDWQKTAQRLSEMGYIYSYNNCIYFSNYNIVRKCLIDVVDKAILKDVAQELFEKVFVENMPNPVKAYLYDILEQGNNVIFEWEKLANINLSMGDFSSYLNCSQEILNALEKYSPNWPAEELQNYKMALYENVANNMYEYNPDQTEKLAHETLKSLQLNGKSALFINLCTKMIQGAIEHGNYIYALDLIHNVLSVMENSSIDPTSKNFDPNFLFITVIYVKILYSIGAWEDCLDIGYNVLNVLDDTKINSIDYSDAIASKEELVYLLNEIIGYISIVDIVTLKENVGEFLEISRKLLSFIPASYDIFIPLQNLLNGQQVTVKANLAGNDIFSQAIYHIINAFTKYKDKPNEFAKEIYKSKLISKEAKMHPLELFADLMIGYAYIGLKSYKKASAIIYKVIKYAKLKGMNAIVHIACYIMSILNIKERKFDLAYGVLNNSEIQMEKNGVISDYLTLLNKVNMYKILMCTKRQEQAQICINQANKIVKKYGINFNLNIDIEQILNENSVVNDVVKLEEFSQETNNSAAEKISNAKTELENQIENFTNKNDKSLEYSDAVDSNEFLK